MAVAQTSVPSTVCMPSVHTVTSKPVIYSVPVDYNTDMPSLVISLQSSSILSMFEQVCDAQTSVMHTACMLSTHGIPLQPLAFKVPVEYHTPLPCSVKHELATHFCQHLVGKPGSVTVFCGAINCDLELPCRQQQLVRQVPCSLPPTPQHVICSDTGRLLACMFATDVCSELDCNDSGTVWHYCLGSSLMHIDQTAYVCSAADGSVCPEYFATLSKMHD